MISEEAMIGMQVRVSEEHRSERLRRQVGTIAERWGDPAYAALDVLMDDGTSQLFWHHELEEIEGGA